MAIFAIFYQQIFHILETLVCRTNLKITKLVNFPLNASHFLQMNFHFLGQSLWGDSMIRVSKSFPMIHIIHSPCDIDLELHLLTFPSCLLGDGQNLPKGFVADLLKDPLYLLSKTVKLRHY